MRRRRVRRGCPAADLVWRAYRFATRALIIWRPTISPTDVVNQMIALRVRRSFLPLRARGRLRRLPKFAFDGLQTAVETSGQF